MKMFLCLVAIIFATSCSQNTGYRPSNKQRLANMVRKKAAVEIQKKTGMNPSGIGGQMMDEIKMLALSFDYYHTITVEEGRELLVTAVNEFLNIINSDEKIRPYLNNYPFKPKNIQIRIFLFNHKGLDVAMGELSVISSIEGILKYDIDNPETNLFKAVYKETYEEALQKINSVPKKAA